MAKKRQPREKKPPRAQPKTVQDRKKAKTRPTRTDKLLEILEMYEWSAGALQDVTGYVAQRIRRFKDRSEVEAYLNVVGLSQPQENGLCIIFRDGDGKIVRAEAYTPSYKVTVTELTEEEYESHDW